MDEQKAIQLGEVIKSERIRLGLTQAELSKKLNKVESAVRMWELGKNRPDSEALVELSKIFNVSVDYLLGLSPRPLIISPTLEGVCVAFNGGLDGLTQEDIDDVSKYVELLRLKRKTENSKADE